MLTSRLITRNDCRPACFRVLFLVKVIVFTRTNISCIALRAKLNKEVSTAATIRGPITYIVASVDLSRVRCLKSAITGVTKRGTKVVIPKMPMVCSKGSPSTTRIVHTETRRLKDPTCRIGESSARILEGASTKVSFTFQGRCCGSVIFSVPFVTGCRIVGDTLTLGAVRILRGIVSMSVSRVRIKVTKAH